MARPFPNTFEQDSPMTPNSASSISYQTNVNRQKTRKWAQAPAVNYGGDDWGDDDDYDPPPPPISKPTGLRQQGQSTAKADSPSFDDGKKYGNLPPLPSATDSRARSNSFDADDERRNFSTPVPQPPTVTTTTSTSNAPATRFSQITGVPSHRNASGPPSLQIQTQQPSSQTGLRQAAPVVSPVNESPRVENPNSGRVNTAESSVVSPASGAPSSASDLYARRDFSPSAVPPPLTTRASPAPQSATDSPSARFPARKSSLSQSMAPPLSEITRPVASDSTAKPWVSGRPASPGPTAKSPISPAGKALPFIRPADIYRRAEEERRQSLESGRPSMDSASGARSSDRSDSPAVTHLKEKSSSDSLGRRRTSLEGDDGSESGRRLMPILEPVRERKSEYGFEGVDVNNSPPQSTAPMHSQAEGSRGALTTGFDEEEARRLSISPKLPDLSRMSGFGLDMFSTPQSETTAVPPTRQAYDVPTTSSVTPPSTADDMTLRSQPSFGFRSVVNQAFDRSDDTSVPATPASTSGSGVNRTDSESTGTTGISPIMSRVSSGAHSDQRNRDGANQSILQVVNEPVSPEVTEREVEDTERGRSIPGFKPGYRRDISTPRSDNSPARTPDLGKTKIITSGHHAVVSDASPELSSVEDEPLQPPRPITEREGSFRPSLPGGWTSYATTAQSGTPPREPSLRAQTPDHDITPVEEHAPSYDLDTTPTASRHTSPIAGHDAGTSGSTMTPLAAAREDRGPPDAPHPATASGVSSRSTTPLNSALPTPDPAMAPGGNLYSTTKLDPRLLPKLEHTPVEAQLRPLPLDRAHSPASSAGSDSAPPPEDGNVSLKSSQHTIQRKPSRSQHASPQPEIVAPPALPALNTDPDPLSDDEENERLHEEIVKSLSPSPRPPEPMLQHDNATSDDPIEGHLPKAGHESSYLPSYYWGGQDESDDVPPMAHGSTRDVEGPDHSIVVDESSPATVAPLSPRRTEQQSLEPPRPTLQGRFSWEDVNAETQRNVPNDGVSEVSAASTPIHAPQATEEVSSVPAQLLSPDNSVDDEMRSVPMVASQPIDQHQQHQHQDHNPDTNAMLAAAGATTLAAAALPAYNATQLQTTNRRLSLAEEKDPLYSSHPVSPTPPEDEHPARAVHPYFATPSDQHSPVPAPSTVSPVASPVLTQQQHFVAAAGPILTFKKIAEMPSAHERIHHFDMTRQRFADMDSGLNDWMTDLQTQYPEHAEAGPFFGDARHSVPGGTARSKFGRATGVAAPTLQQPYYQQYLNASSPTTPSTPVQRPGSGPHMTSGTSGTQQGFSSNSGKLTSQQVQAKGKELLHSAGLFGGKAGKAGKGLLAKGKSKFRGGGEKTSPPPKPKNDQPKQERRTSWGLPLVMSRSSGRPDGSARQSTELLSNNDRPRATTTTSDRSISAPQLPDIHTGDSLGLMSGAIPLANGMTSEGHREQPQPSTIRQVQTGTAVTESESRDNLGVPAPIGKHQPSWDPYNAAPIAEEEVFQYEERPREPQASLDVGNRYGSLALPLGHQSTSERSNSDDSHFYSAQEEPSDIPNDWVMVSPSDTKDTNSFAPQPIQDRQLSPPVDLAPRNSIDAPVTSILNRPRGSSYEIPSPPPSAKGPSPQSMNPTHITTSPSHFQTSLSRPAEPTNIAPLNQYQSSPPKPVQVEPENQPTASSFLPPIRRTSTFGLGFGSRHVRPRFPLEDENDHSSQDFPRPSGPTVPHSMLNGFQVPVNTAQSPPIGVRVVTDLSHDGPRQVHTSVAAQQASAQRPVTTEEGPRHQRQPEQQQKSVSEQIRSSHQSIPSQHISAPANQAIQNPRPLSFVQTINTGETFQAPPKALEQKDSINDDMFSKETGGRVEPHQLRDQAHRQIPARGQIPPAVTQHTPSLSGVTSRQPLVQNASSYHSEKSDQSQKTANPSQYQHQNAVGFRPSNTVLPPEQAQRSMQLPPAPQSTLLPPLVTPRASDVLQRPEFRESQVEWRSTRPKATNPVSQVSPTFWKEVDMPPPRQSNSWEPQRPRGNSGSSQGTPHRADPPHNERAAWNGQGAQAGGYTQPPSSAQRYPDLFRPGQAADDTPRENADLPDHLYQAPTGRADAFLPRQQTSEYQIAGVGPPLEEPRSATSRRNSGFFKEIGGKLSRASSRDRRNSVSRDRDEAPPSPVRPLESRGGEYAESSVASEGEVERTKRRSSFFGNLGRGSTAGLGPPQSRESVIAHNSASRTDLLVSPQPSPVHQDKKRSIFGSSSKEPKEPKESKQKPGKLVRASTGSTDVPGKKQRFSGLSNMFGGKTASKAPVQERPQAPRELSYNERQPIESPQLNTQRPIMNSTPPGRSRADSQTRQALKKLTSSSSPSASPRPESKTRRSSGGLLGGLMGRRSNQQDRGSDDSRSQGSSQPMNPSQVLPTAQTYTDLQQQQQPQQQQQRQQQSPPPMGLPMGPPPRPQQRNVQNNREMPFQDPSLRVDMRGRNPAREPQYDTVPIPGGYELVRGQGAIPIATKYDPRGLGQMPPVDPRYTQSPPNGQYRPNGSQQGPPQQHMNDVRHGPGPQPSTHLSPDIPRNNHPKPQLGGAVETYEAFVARTAPRRLSREDLLARSPPKHLPGQQRPYQLSLPGGDEEERPTPIEKDPVKPGPVAKQSFAQHDAIQRLQQPTLRHPESPAGYPLPEDTVFSPVDPRVNDIPAPPPPQWPTHMETSHNQNTQHDRQASLSTLDGDLDRSNTRRTAISAVSGLSGGLNVPNRQISDATETDRDRRHTASPSPSPPSPMPGTPERGMNPESRQQSVDHMPAQNQGNDIRTTEVEVRHSRDDLYDASPRLPPPNARLPRELTMNDNINTSPTNGHAYANILPGNRNSLQAQPLGKENYNVGRSVSAAVQPSDSAGLRPDGQQITRAASSSQAQQAQAQEEKIPYSEGIAGRVELPTEDDREPVMVATSYPGMEWNPYGAGAWDDGFD